MKKQKSTAWSFSERLQYDIVIFCFVLFSYWSIDVLLTHLYRDIFFIAYMKLQIFVFLYFYEESIWMIFTRRLRFARNELKILYYDFVIFCHGQSVIMFLWQFDKIGVFSCYLHVPVHCTRSQVSVHCREPTLPWIPWFPWMGKFLPWISLIFFPWIPWILKFR